MKTNDLRQAHGNEVVAYTALQRADRKKAAKSATLETAIGITGRFFPGRTA